MMLPDSHAPIPSTQAAPITPLASTTGPEENSPHADYNRHPLEVHSLDHYVKYEGDERFHVC
ncbi:MAG: hypothetical protein ACREPQ_05670 [Rhodanobacter sp.]